MTKTKKATKSKKGSEPVLNDAFTDLLECSPEHIALLQKVKGGSEYVPGYLRMRLKERQAK